MTARISVVAGTGGYGYTNHGHRHPAHRTPMPSSSTTSSRWRSRPGCPRPTSAGDCSTSVRQRDPLHPADPRRPARLGRSAFPTRFGAGVAAQYGHRRRQRHERRGPRPGRAPPTNTARDDHRRPRGDRQRRPWPRSSPATALSHGYTITVTNNGPVRCPWRDRHRRLAGRLSARASSSRPRGAAPRSARVPPFSCAPGHDPRPGRAPRSASLDRPGDHPRGRPDRHRQRVEARSSTRPPANDVATDDTTVDRRGQPERPRPMTARSASSPGPAATATRSRSPTPGPSNTHAVVVDDVIPVAFHRPGCPRPTSAATARPSVGNAIHCTLPTPRRPARLGRSAFPTDGSAAGRGGPDGHRPSPAPRAPRTRPGRAPPTTPPRDDHRRPSG